VSLRGLEEGCCRRSPLRCPHRGGSGWLGTVDVVLTHRCHSHLAAHDRICKAVLITIVMRARFLAGSVPPLCGRAGLSSPRLHGARLAVVAPRGHACVSVLFATIPSLPVAC